MFCFKLLGTCIVSKAELAARQNKNRYCLEKKYDKMLLKSLNAHSTATFSDEKMSYKHIKTKYAADKKPIDDYNQ